MDTAQGRLAEWVQLVQPLIVGLEAFGVSLAPKPDLEGDSLRELEEIVLERLGGPEDLADENEQGFVEGAVAYLGETLLRIGGGSWVWDAGTDGPAVRADAALDLPPVSPLGLLATATRARDGEQFAAVGSAWAAAVEAVTVRRPSWRPVKEPTPGLDPSGADDAHLVDWLARRAAGFADWAASHPPADSWDFSPGSLDALEEIVRRVTPTGEALDDPANGDFVDGAAWYLGEVLRRGLGGGWFYRKGDDTVLAGEYLGRVGPRDEVLEPSIYLRVVLRKPGFLRKRYERISR